MAITAAMASGTGLEKFANVYPKRFFDVGIAEQHAVTFAAGLATEGMLPVVAVIPPFYKEHMTRYCMMSVYKIFTWFLLWIDRALWDRMEKPIRVYLIFPI